MEELIYVFLRFDVLIRDCLRFEKLIRDFLRVKELICGLLSTRLLTKKGYIKPLLVHPHE